MKKRLRVVDKCWEGVWWRGVVTKCCEKCCGELL